MEAITLCGLVIVMFGLWVEFEAAVKTLVKTICNSRFITDAADSEARSPVYRRRMSI